MVRGIWSGAISFGLVNIPVKVVTAVSEKDVRFHLLHGKDGARIKFKRVCPQDGKEVPQEEMVRGFEVGRGQYVTFTDDELEAADPKAARTIDILEFVVVKEIDPSYYDRPYYLVPDKNADKAYALLRAALERTGKAGIARVVMRDKEYLVAIRAKQGAILMETLHFADEVIPPESLSADLPAAGAKDVDKKQLALAEQLIGNLSEPFSPEKHRNAHRERILELVEKKAEGKQIVAEPAVKLAPKTTDILAALERSLAQAKRKARAAA